MNAFDRFVTWLVPHIPRLKKAVEVTERRAGKLREALNNSRAESIALEQLARDLALRTKESEERLRQITELRYAEELCRMPDQACYEMAASHIGEVATPVKVEQMFKERLWELELALEDRGWVREVTLSALEFSRYGVQQLIRICRIYAIKNPIIKRITEICELYVFGRGIEIRSDDGPTNDAIQDFLQRNDAEMGHCGLARKERDIQSDGAIYWSLPTIKDQVSVLMIDPLEIMDVITDPDDSSKPLYFKRMWHRNEIDFGSGMQRPKMQMCWYPSLELVMENPKPKQPTMGGVEINWEQPILRDSGGGSPSKWRWPVPPVYAAIDSSRAYIAALEDYATVRRTLARFALMIETKGGPGAIAAYQALFSTTFADNDGTQIESNPPPVVGSAHVSGPSNKIAAFKSSGAQSNPEETRRILLLACSSAGMPETFFGDASTGSLATAVSLDRPTELKFSAIQKRWKHTLRRIIDYVLMVEQSTVGSRLHEARSNAKPSKPVAVKIEFPTVIEHEILPMIQSIVEIGTGGGRNGIFAGIVDRRTIAGLLLAEIGYEDRDELLDSIYGKNYKAADDVTDQRSQPSPQMLTQAIGKAITDLSTPPPLPTPPPVPAPTGFPPKPGVPAALPAAKVGSKATKKEAVVTALAALRSALEREPEPAEPQYTK
jgi:hypothetical protein